MSALPPPPSAGEEQPAGGRQGEGASDAGHDAPEPTSPTPALLRPDLTTPPLPARFASGPSPAEGGGKIDTAGGRIFSSRGRSLEAEDEIRLTSVGIDIGSATSHLVVSRLVLERLDARYVVTSREVLHESAVLLTPYADDGAIDAQKLGAFIAEQYALAGIRPEAVDTGALILTGVAVRRRNARAIGDLFAGRTGQFVAVSAGDALETTLAAYGSGAVARSIRENASVMNVDIGGGTSKIALCAGGGVVDLTALDVGARVVCFGADGRVERLEEAGRRFGDELGLRLAVGGPVADDALQALAEHMAERLFQAMGGAALDERTTALLRLDPLLPMPEPPAAVTFSGGVAEYFYGREHQNFGDLGPFLAEAIKARVAGWGPRIEAPVQGIRATVVGASQYTIQVSGSTIFVQPLDVLPLRNVPALAPDLPLAADSLDPAAIAAAIRGALRRLDLHGGEQAVALCYRWDGSATFDRLDSFCRGVREGLSALLARGHPLVLVGDRDIGGLIGLHCHEELGQPRTVSVDGVALKEFDFVDIGALMEVSGSVPVVIKSLVFPTTAALGREAEERPSLRGAAE